MGAASEPRSLDGVDVRAVAEALDDGDPDTTWWYDPSTGQAEPGSAGWMADELGDDDDPEDRGLVPIDSNGSRAAYDDMVTFASAVGDRRAADLLERALEGRGAFRRGRDRVDVARRHRDHDSRDRQRGRHQPGAHACLREGCWWSHR